MSVHRDLSRAAPTSARTPGHDGGHPPNPGHDGGTPQTPGARRLSRRAQAALPLSAVAEGMVVRRLRVRPADVVFVKGVIEASEGLAGVFAEQGGDLLLAGSPEREGELVELLADLTAELSTSGGGP
jgi:hypothetical protein